MTIHRIDNNDTYVTEVVVRESDKYTKAAYVRFERNIIPEGIRGCNEMFLSTKELRQLGHFLASQAEAIEAEQRIRKE